MGYKQVPPLVTCVLPVTDGKSPFSWAGIVVRLLSYLKLVKTSPPAVFLLTLSSESKYIVPETVPFTLSNLSYWK
jgi:hypothetical protein